MAFFNMQKMQKDLQSLVGGESAGLDFTVDGENITRSGAKRGRGKVLEVRARVEAAIDSGQVEDETLDLCEDFLTGVLEIQTALQTDAGKSDDSAIILASAQAYGELADAVESLLQQLEGQNFPSLAASLAEMDGCVERIETLLENAQDLPAEGPADDPGLA